MCRLELPIIAGRNVTTTRVKQFDQVQQSVKDTRSNSSSI